MKMLQRLISITLLLTLLLISCEKNNDPEFPDSNLYQALLEKGMETNNDGIISKYEAEYITLLNLSEYDISDLSGIELFTNLETLICHNNSLTSLDVSKLTKLVKLNCRENQIAELDVSNNTILNLLECGGNLLSYLDISNNTALINLIINDLPTLEQVCVWVLPFPPDKVNLDTTNSPNVVFTNDCL